MFNINMKKIAFGLSMLLMIFGLTVFGDNIEKFSSDTVTITPNINKKSINDINNIILRFCNDWVESEKLTRQLQIQTQPWKKEKVCMVFFSEFTGQDTKVEVSLVDWTKRSDGSITCSEDGSGSIFSKMVNNNKDTFVLWKEEFLIKKFDINLKKTLTGSIYWCVTYNLPDNFIQNTWDIFGVVVRKVAPIEIMITWDVYKFWRRDDTKNIYTENKQTILKIIIAIIAVRLILSIVKAIKKPQNDKNKKSKK